jgi:hypothetical protein
LTCSYAKTPAISPTLPQTSELESLVDIYFSTIHYFSFFSFIHPKRFRMLMARGKTPQDLTMMMCACAVRYAFPLILTQDLQLH